MKRVVSILFFSVLSASLFAADPPPEQQKNPPPAAPAAATMPTAAELLAKYAANMDGFDRFIMNFASDCEHEFINEAPFPPNCDSHDRDELRFDNNKRMKLTQDTWGTLYQRSNSEVRPYYTARLWDGRQEYQITGRRGMGTTVHITSGTRNNAEEYISICTLGGNLLGYVAKDGPRFDRFLMSNLDKATVRPRREKIGGSDCYVIEADTFRGKYFVWLDPAHGYSLKKAAVDKDWKDKLFDVHQIKKGETAYFEVNVTRYERYRNSWIPAEANGIENYFRNDGRISKTKYTVALTKVQLNPDFDALESFAADDIAEGARAYIGGQNKRYYWHNNGLVEQKPAKGTSSVSLTTWLKRAEQESKQEQPVEQPEGADDGAE